MNKVGISDVARRAQVSEATVSRVINSRGVVAPQTRQAVEDAMRDLGYVRGTTGSVVLVVTPGLDDYFFGLLTDELSTSLAVHGLKAVACSASIGGVQEPDFVSAMVELGVSGVIFASASNTLDNADPRPPRLLAARHVPFLCINGAFDGVRAPTLSTNDDLAASMVVDHLWGLGHRRIGMIAGPVGNRPSDRRVAGFLAAMGRRGAGAAELVVRRPYSIEGGYAGAGPLIDHGVTAIAAASDEIAMGAIRAIKRAGRHVPGDISVVGYDDAYPLEFMDPPLTSVRQPISRLSQAAAGILMRQIQHRPVDDAELLFDPELVTRGSTAPLDQ